MVEQIVSPPIIPDESAVSAEEYMLRYAAEGYEWVKGKLEKMSPISLRHERITTYLRTLLESYFEIKPIGVVLGEPFVMRLDAVESRREPDLQVILNTNSGELTDTAMIGAADICIEVVSPESVARDHGEKFEEYEKAGVREYWIIDPVRELCRFNRLTENNLYSTISPDADGIYETPLLPNLRLHVSALWQDELPKPGAIVQAVQAMLKESE